MVPQEKKKEAEPEEQPTKVTFNRKREKKLDGKKEERPKKDSQKIVDKVSGVKLSFADDEEY